MASPSTLATRLRYGLSRMSYSAAVSLKRYEAGEIRIGEFAGCLWNNFFQGKLTSMHWAGNIGSAMAPIIPSNGAAIVIRELPCSNPMRVFVGDVVVIRHAEEPSKVLIRRAAAIEGDEMVSTDEKDEPFVLANNQCWVLEDDPSSTPKGNKYVSANAAYKMLGFMQHRGVTLAEEEKAAIEALIAKVKTLKGAGKRKLS